MSTKTCYVFVCADGMNDAVDSVERWLDDYLGREFYEGFEVVKESACRIGALREQRGYADARLAEIENRLRQLRIDAEAFRSAGDRDGEGIILSEMADILCERLSISMPWFNIERWDWQIPDGEDYWAVMVTFHL